MSNVSLSYSSAQSGSVSFHSASGMAWSVSSSSDAVGAVTPLLAPHHGSAQKAGALTAASSQVSASYVSATVRPTTSHQTAAALLIAVASLALTSAPLDASPMTKFVSQTAYQYHLQLASIPAPALSDRMDHVAIARLRDLAAYEPGWNGPRSEGALKPSFVLAEAMVGLLFVSAKVREIEPTIFSDGCAALEIMTNDGKMLLSISQSGDISANIDAGEDSIDLDIEGFDGEVLPPELSVYL